MALDDIVRLRGALASMDASGSHSATGANRPRPNEIFAPAQHAGALDPNITVVLGARGAGKSFWAGVLGDKDTREVAASAYPRLGLQRLRVSFGFTGVDGDKSVSRSTIDFQVPEGQEGQKGILFWRCVLLRSAQTTIGVGSKPPRIGEMMKQYEDPEEWEAACEELNDELAEADATALVIFDALDSVAVDWQRLRKLLDALLEVCWTTRGYSNLRTKVFLRPDQMYDLGLRYVELPKLLAGATKLWWRGEDLYGMLFNRLVSGPDQRSRDAFLRILESEGIPEPQGGIRQLRRWPLTADKKAQALVFTRLAGSYMGRSNKKGRTYDWPLNHLADGFGDVTPRSFLTLMISAAQWERHSAEQVITSEAIRHGLREASKVRVNQLELEFPWVKRALAPLARLQVPCHINDIVARWEETQTVAAVMKPARRGEFLPPFKQNLDYDDEELLAQALVRIGVLLIRADSRFDMPDLFRVAARLLKKGGVAPGG